MAGGHGHGGGGHDHGHGGGGGPGLSFDLSIGGTPMGFLSLAGTAIGALIALDLIWLAWLAATDYVGWHAIVLPFLLVLAIFLNPTATGKILATVTCLMISTLFLWVTIKIAQSMWIKIDEPFVVRTPDAAGWLRLIMGWIFCAIILLIPASISSAVAAFAWWLWWGKSLKGDHH